MKVVAFHVFKWTVYSLLALDTLLFLSVAGKVDAFLDSAAWLVLLGVMEYESSTLDQAYSSRREKMVLAGLNLFAYSVIVFALSRYIIHGLWLDAVNAGAWLGVCAVLIYQMYAPGEYEGGEVKLLTALKVALYGTLIACALIWTLATDELLDTADSWLWLLCFAVIELNVFGFDMAEQRRSENGQDETIAVEGATS
ncbi:hypothetical protein [Amorphus coralli]|uniref:hypothetical protein n=1 Tax=Amorphus coralli TaxID=340680 RepID=UPI00037FA937|nr:hypothetical protein [Amorphus coralli]